MNYKPKKDRIISPSKLFQVMDFLGLDFAELTLALDQAQMHGRIARRILLPQPKDCYLLGIPIVFGNVKKFTVEFKS